MSGKTVDSICSGLGGRNREYLPVRIFCVLTHINFFQHSTWGRTPKVPLFSGNFAPLMLFDYKQRHVADVYGACF